MDYRFLLGIAVAVAVMFFAATFAQNLVRETAGHHDHETLYQVSTIDVLMLGMYEGVRPFSEIRKHGDFGIGTFNALDGEMVAVEGNYFQVRSDGTVYPVTDAMSAPFAMVTFFEPDLHVTADREMNFTVFSSFVSDHLPSQNMIYAVRVDGSFPAMKIRSVPRQAPPYLPLTAAVANQSVFEYHDAKGTVAGFFMPGFMQGLNMPGYHLHYISTDRKTGGHVLEFTLAKDTTAVLDITPSFTMMLPVKGPFAGANLSKDSSSGLARAER